MRKKRLRISSVKPAVVVSIANVMLLLSLPMLLFSNSTMVFSTGIRLPAAAEVRRCDLIDANPYIIFITRDERIFIAPGVGAYTRHKLLDQITDYYQLTLTDAQRKQFEQGPLIGSSMRTLPGKISFARLREQPGIPFEKGNNQLADLIALVRHDRSARFLIFADEDVSSGFFRKVADELRQTNVNRFYIYAVYGK